MKLLIFTIAMLLSFFTFGQSEIADTLAMSEAIRNAEFFNSHGDIFFSGDKEFLDVPNYTIIGRYQNFEPKADTLIFDCMCKERISGCYGDCEKLVIKKKRGIITNFPFTERIIWIDNVKGCYRLDKCEK